MLCGEVAALLHGMQEIHPSSCTLSKGCKAESRLTIPAAWNHRHGKDYPSKKFFSAAPRQSDICVKVSVFHTVFDETFW